MSPQGLIAVLTIFLGVEIYIGLNIMKDLHDDCRNKTEQLFELLNDIMVKQEDFKLKQENVYQNIEEVKQTNKEIKTEQVIKVLNDISVKQNEFSLKQEVIHKKLEEVKQTQERKNDGMEKKVEGGDNAVNNRFKTYTKENNSDGIFLPRDCQDIQSSGHNTTGIYTIYTSLENIEIRVRCDMDTAPGGWTVFQRRVSASDFYKTWNEYQVGFGNMSDNFWLGNQQIHSIVSQGWFQLRIDLTNIDDQTRYAEYQVFTLDSAESQYKLFVDGFSGNVGDSLSYHSGMMFSTKDRDNDLSLKACAQEFIGAWWYKSCQYSNLNGDYGNTKYGKGPVWFSWMGYHSPLKKTEMKIRRRERLPGEKNTKNNSFKLHTKEKDVGSSFLPRDCQDIQSSGHNTTGVYTIYPFYGNNKIRVRCDMDTAPGGWTVFQRRISASDFFKTWNEYQVGFGNLRKNFWLGNQQIYLILSQGRYKLRIDMTNLSNQKRYAEYQIFFLGGAESQYKLFVDGYSGNAGDGFSYHNGMMFSTKDRDNDDLLEGSCAQEFTGAWWYQICYDSNLNGDYGNKEFGKGLIWYDWTTETYSTLIKTEMKIRRLQIQN